jgi:hypothetical protein
MGPDKPGVTAIGYRKGELQPNMIDIERPHQIAVLAPGGHVKSYTQIREFIQDRGLSRCERGHTFGNLVDFYIVYWFAEAENAAIILTRFGGASYNRK